MFLSAGCGLEPSPLSGASPKPPEEGSIKENAKEGSPSGHKASRGSQGRVKWRERTDSGRTRGQTTEKARNTVLVTRVVDGDTVEVSHIGVLDIRLIGIDTPETVHPTEPVECYGPAASRFTKESLEEESVHLEFDIERRDHYGRTLAYVWDEGKLFNQVLVERGFATVTTYPPNTKYVARFTAAERRARRANRGLWGACAERGGSNATRALAGSGGAASARSGSGGDCDPNYKGACIPPYPPDLDCDTMPSVFQSIGSDPHGFDGNDDGVACE